MGLSEWLLLGLLSLVWGGSFFFTEVALEEVGPFTIVLVRLGLAALALLLLVRLSGQRLPASRGAWGAFLLMGALNNFLPFCLIVWGQLSITGSLASILIAATPLFSVVLAHFLTSDERMTGRKLAGVAVGFAGILLLIGPDALEELGGAVAAQLAVVAAAFCYALSNVFGRRFHRTTPLVSASAQVACSALLVLPLALLLERPWNLPLPGAETLLSLVGLALLSTALAYVLFYRVLNAAGATNLSLVSYLVPISAILLGTTILGERLGAFEIAGMFLVLLGLAVLDGRLLAFRRA